MQRLVLTVSATLLIVTGATYAWTADGSATDPATAATAVPDAPADATVAETETTAAPASSHPQAAAADPLTCEERSSSERDITRISGFDRYATAACASAVGYPLGATTAVLARGDSAGGYADALAGTVLAHHVQGPVLLTAPDALPAATSDELVRLGADLVLVLGGDEAVSPEVVAAVEATGATVERIEGADRSETAAAITTRAGATEQLFVVNGFRPADALVAGAVAARAGAGLVLVSPDGVPGSTAQRLAEATSATIVGGFGVVPESVETAIRQQVANVTRLSGSSRDETAASVARALPAEGTLHVVSGRDDNLVDAIAAGWLAAQPGGGAVVYSQPDTPGRGTDRYLRLGGLDGAPAVRLIGGDAVLQPELVTALEERLTEAEAGGPAPQTRAMWVHLFDSSLKSRRSIASVLDTAASNNLNTVIAQVVRRHDSYSTSAVLPRTSDPSMPADLDLLAELTEQAHARGLELHAWVVVANAWHSSYGSPSDLPPNHIYRTHGPSAPETERWMTRSQDGTWSTQYLDAGVPAFQDHIVALTEEIAQRYPVDAVHLDYIRYPEGGQWGYNPLARAQWQAEGSPDFADWRRAQTEKITQRVKQAVSAARPGTLVSMAGIAQGDGPAGVGGFHNTRAYAQTYQDWAGWLARDVVDVVYPMAYMREDGVSSSCVGFSTCEHRVWYDHWVQFAHSLAGSEEIAIGQGSWLNSVAQSMSQLSEAVGATDGVVLYSYQQDSAKEPHGALIAELARTLFAQPAPSR